MLHMWNVTLKSKYPSNHMVLIIWYNEIERCRS